MGHGPHFSFFTHSLTPHKSPSVPQKAQKHVDLDTMMMSLPCDEKAVDGDLQLDTLVSPTLTNPTHCMFEDRAREGRR